MSEKPLEDARAAADQAHDAHRACARRGDRLGRRHRDARRTGRSRGKLELNDLGVVRFRLAEPLAVDPYARNRATGAFILIDEATNDTVGAGMVVEARRDGSRVSSRDPYRDLDVIDSRAPRTNQAVIGVVSVLAVVTGWWWLLALLALQLAVGLTFGRRYCLPCVAYFELIQPRFGEGPLEDSRPPRAANIVGLVVLARRVGRVRAGWHDASAPRSACSSPRSHCSPRSPASARAARRTSSRCLLRGKPFVSCPIRRAVGAA